MSMTVLLSIASSSLPRSTMPILGARKLTVIFSNGENTVCSHFSHLHIAGNLRLCGCCSYLRLHWTGQRLSRHIFRHEQQTGEFSEELQIIQVIEFLLFQPISER
jgi:hypothetical protein